MPELVHQSGLPKSDRGPSLRRIMTTFRSSILAILMPVIILGGILSGVVTPTEAAAAQIALAVRSHGLCLLFLRGERGKASWFP